jgi:hypothetical protein
MWFAIETHACMVIDGRRLTPVEVVELKFIIARSASLRRKFTCAASTIRCPVSAGTSTIFYTIFIVS